MNAKVLASRSYFMASSGDATGLILGKRLNAIKSKKPESCLNVLEYNHEHYASQRLCGAH